MTRIADHNHVTHTPSERHSLVGLVKDLRDEVTLLLRQEVELAKREMQEKIDEAKRNTIAMAVGALLALAGGLLVLLAASNGLTAAFVEMGMDGTIAVWLAPLILGIAVAIAGYLMIRTGRERLESQTIKPEKTLDSLEETGRWAKERVSQ